MADYQTITRGDESKRVRLFQEALERLGHDFPRHGADGEAGTETFGVVEEFMYCRGEADNFDEHGVNISSVLVELIHVEADVFSPLPERPIWPGPWLHDYRLEDTSKQRGLRKWSEVEGITLHQMACLFMPDLDPSPERLRKAINRVKKIKCHFSGLRSGDVTFNAPLDRVMAHGHAFNDGDVGIEIDGYYAGVHGDGPTFWKPKKKPNRKPLVASQKQMDSIRAICKYIVKTVASYGGEVKYIHAHRQTHGGKPSDPGSIIWQEVGLYCKHELGLTDEGPEYYVPHHRNKKRGGRSSKAGPGRPIPVQWDPSNTRKYRYRPKK